MITRNEREALKTFETPQTFDDAYLTSPFKSRANFGLLVKSLIIKGELSAHERKIERHGEKATIIIFSRRDSNV